MEAEVKEVMEVWISTLASLSYCYFISFNLPKGFFRLLSLLPIFYVFVILPFKISIICISSSTAFLLTWLLNFKLLLFSFNQGPLSINSSISFPHFIFIAIMPIMIKENKETPSSKIPSTSNFLIKFLLFIILGPIYQYKEEMNPKMVVVVYYCLYIYLTLELGLALAASFAKIVLGIDVEKQFNEPWKSTSLQDFWGRRWNLTVSNTLKASVYLPSRYIFMKMFGRRWAMVPAMLSVFIVSGLMHEVIFMYIRRERPTWEVTFFFVLHGIFVVLEILMKKVVRCRLNPVFSVVLTLGVLVATVEWLFFPPLLRSGADVTASRELGAGVNYVKNLGRLVVS